MGRITDTRIVDEDIQTALALENLFGHHAPPVFIRHVVPDKARALTQLACIGLALGGSVGQNHAAALFDEQLGDRSPYSGCSTSDDRSVERRVGNECVRPCRHRWALNSLK